MAWFNGAEKSSKSSPESPNPYPVYVGKCDYNNRTDEDLGFKKGDQMYIINTEDEDWWLACSKDSGKEGYVFRHYVAEWKSLDAEEWFFGCMKREEAEELLMQPFNSVGSFMVRDSPTIPGDFILSIRDEERVRHYKVTRLENGSFFVTRRITFETIQNLVAYYSQQADGLPIHLIQPCLMSEKPQTAGPSNEEWEIDRRQIKFMWRLGTGEFADVWEGQWNNMSLAVKTLKAGTISPQEFLQEAEIMKKLVHPNLVELYVVCTQEKPIYIFTKWMRHGSLLEFMQKGEGRSLKLPQLVNACAQVTHGMAYLVEHNYIHRDLAARNILVGDDMICKVGNLHMATVLGKDMNQAHKVSIKWAAPEVAMYNSFTAKSDVWSFGIVVYEVVTYGRVPYPGMTHAQVLEAVPQGYRMPRPVRCPEKLYDIMLDCWKEDPASRPTFEILRWQLEDFFMQ